MSLNFGGSSEKREQTQQTQVAPPTPQEQALTNAQLEAEQFRLFLMQRAAADEESRMASPAGQRDAELNQLLQETALARLKGASPVISPAAQERINTVYGAREFEGMRSLNEAYSNDAAARGMTATDSPIANAKALAVADFLRGLQSSRASSELDVGNTEAIFNENMRQFQNQLQQQAFQNRMALASAPTPGLGLNQLMFQQRLASAPQTQSYSGSGSTKQGGFSLGEVGKGAAGLASAYNTIWGPR